MFLYTNGKIRKYFIRFGLAALLLLVVSSFSLQGQERRSSRQNRRNRAKVENVADSLSQMSDSARVVRDSLFRADSIARQDSLNLLSKSSLEAPAFSVAKDSVIEDFSNGKRMIY